MTINNFDGISMLIKTCDNVETIKRLHKKVIAVIEREGRDRFTQDLLNQCRSKYSSIKKRKSA